jgi:hypothetical protein
MPAISATSPSGSTSSRKSRHEGDVLIRRLVFIAFFLEVGLLLIVLPWSSFWEGNYFALTWPSVRPFLVNNFVRGAVTGLGIVNLCAAFADLTLVFSARERSDPAGPTAA